MAAITKYFLRLLVVLAIVLVAFPMASHASILTFNTSDSRFRPSRNNQGWWSYALANGVNNDNPIMGQAGDFILRDYFTFDLSSLPSGVAILGASLQLERGGDLGGGAGTFWDVSTNTAYLNTGIGPDATVWDDLGSGVQYGSFSVGSGPPLDIITISLNSEAINAIGTARGGFFSVGGRADSGYIFAGNADGVRRLLVNVSVPEPGHVGVLSMFSFFLLRKTRVIASIKARKDRTDRMT